MIGRGTLGAIGGGFKIQEGSISYTDFPNLSVVVSDDERLPWLSSKYLESRR